MVGGGDPFYPKFWVKPHWSEIADFQSIFACSASAVASSKKAIDTNRKSTTQFSMSLRWTSYVVPKPPPQREGASKTHNGRFPCTIALRLKKVCYKFFMRKLSATKL